MVGTQLARVPFSNLKALVFQIVSLHTLPVFKTGAFNHSATSPTPPIEKLARRWHARP